MVTKRSKAYATHFILAALVQHSFELSNLPHNPIPSDPTTTNDQDSDSDAVELAQTGELDDKLTASPTSVGSADVEINVNGLRGSHPTLHTGTCLGVGLPGSRV